jgi:hypothetical protein
LLTAPIGVLFSLRNSIGKLKDALNKSFRFYSNAPKDMQEPGTQTTSSSKPHWHCSALLSELFRICDIIFFYISYLELKLCSKPREERLGKEQ